MSQDNVEIVRRAYSLAKESETYSFVAANHDLYDEYFHHDAELARILQQDFDLSVSRLARA
jgi:hypothetical protein